MGCVGTPWQPQYLGAASARSTHWEPHVWSGSRQGKPAAAMGSTGMWLADPRVAPRVSHRAVQRGQVLAAVPSTPGRLAFVPTAWAVAFGP